MRRYFAILLICILPGCQGDYARETNPAGPAPAELPAQSSSAVPDIVPWVVYYNNQAPVEAFAPFDLIVLDSDYHPPLSPLLALGKQLLGYLSLGEVEDYRSYFAEVQAEGLLLEENPNWPGSYLVDVRDVRWRNRVIGSIIPAILARGFDGLFLDTLDSSIAAEQHHPLLYAGMITAAIQLVLDIRQAYPDVPIMLNRAYHILPSVVGAIDMELGEDVYTCWDFVYEEYRLVDEAVYQEQVNILRAAQQQNPALKVMTLDYWDPSDSAFISSIFDIQRANSFSPYVSTLTLDQIILEPDDNQGTRERTRRPRIE